MGGCMLPIMSCCGSGNQGLTATLPIIPVCQIRSADQAVLYRLLGCSLLVTTSSSIWANCRCSNELGLYTILNFYLSIVRTDELSSG